MSVPQCFLSRSLSTILLVVACFWTQSLRQGLSANALLGRYSSRASRVRDTESEAGQKEKQCKVMHYRPPTPATDSLQDTEGQSRHSAGASALPHGMSWDRCHGETTPQTLKKGKERKWICLGASHHPSPGVRLHPQPSSPYLYIVSSSPFNGCSERPRPMLCGLVFPLRPEWETQNVLDMQLIGLMWLNHTWHVESARRVAAGAERAAEGLGGFAVGRIWPAMRRTNSSLSWSRTIRLEGAHIWDCDRFQQIAFQ